MVLANRFWDENARTLTCDLAAIYFDDEEHIAVDPRTLDSVVVADLAGFQGQYDVGDSGTREILYQDGTLIWVTASGGQIALVPIGSDAFILDGRPHIIVRFRRETGEGVTSFSASRCGDEFLAGVGEK